MSETITWGDCSESEYLKKEDIYPPEGVTVTIEAYQKKTIKGNGGEPDKEKVCVKFKEFDKWLVVNSTNGSSLKADTGSDSPAESIGKRIDIYVNNFIEFAGKTVGGIRFKPFEAGISSDSQQDAADEYFQGS